MKIHVLLSIKLWCHC